MARVPTETLHELIKRGLMSIQDFRTEPTQSVLAIPQAWLNPVDVRKVFTPTLPKVDHWAFGRRVADPFLKQVEDEWQRFAETEDGRQEPQLGPVYAGAGLRPIGEAVARVVADVLGDPDGPPVPLSVKQAPERVVPAFPAATYGVLTRGDGDR